MEEQLSKKIAEMYLMLFFDKLVVVRGVTKPTVFFLLTSLVSP